MAFEILLTGDTFNEGRIKINDGLNELDSNFWTANTVSGITSLTSTSDENSNNSIYAIVQGARNSADSISTASRIIGADNSIVDSVMIHVEGTSNSVNKSGFSFIGGINNDITKSQRSFIFSSSCSIQQRSGAASAYKATILASLDSNIFSNINNQGAGQSIIASKDVLIEDGDEITNILSPISSRNSSIIASELCWISGATKSFIIGTRLSQIENNIVPVALSPSINEGNVVMAGTASHITNSARSVVIGGSSEYFGAYQNDILNSKESSILSSIDSYVGFSFGSSIIGGSTNVISSGSVFFTIPADSTDNYTNNCIIIAGYGHTINKYNSGSWAPNQLDLNECAIVGGNANNIHGPKQNNSVVIGGWNNNIYRIYTSNALGNFQNNIVLGGNNNSIPCQSFSNASVENTVILGGSSKTIDNDTQRDFLYLAGKSFTPTPLIYYESFQAGSVGVATIAFDIVNGNGYWDGGISIGPADYAEYFEWNDGNLSNEKRYGYAVSLVEDKIEISNSNIIGIVSPNPGVVADTQSFNWKNTFLLDEFGRKIIDTYKVYKVNSGQTEVYINDNEVAYLEYPSGKNTIGTFYNDDLNDKEFIKNKNVPRINPNYDKYQEYLSRKERKEWSPIGMLGKLHVRTSEQITGNKVSFDINGEAINGTDYNVLKSIKDYDGDYGIVQILFK